MWGEIRDEDSLKVVERTYDLPAHVLGMTMLDKPISFTIELLE